MTIRAYCFACMHTTTKRECMHKHVIGAAPMHYSFAKTKRSRPGETESSSQGMSMSSDFSDEGQQLAQSPNSVARRTARRVAREMPAPATSSSSTN